MPAREVDQAEAPGYLPPLHESWLPSEHPMYRPRHGARQRAALAIAVVFFSVPILLFCLGVQPAAIENRRLAGFPALTDGWGAWGELQLWASDHLPLRDVAITAADGVSRSVFREPPSLGGRGGGPAVADTLGRPGAADRGDPGLGPLRSGFPTGVEGANGWLYLGDDMFLKCRPHRPMTETFAALRRLKDAVEQSGRTFVLVVPPDKSDLFPENLPQRYVGKNCAQAADASFWPGLADLGHLDLRGALREEAQRLERPVYFATDTHWTFDGGLLMTRTVAEHLQPGVTAGWRAWDREQVDWRTDIPPLIGRQTTEKATLVGLAPDGGEQDRTRYRTSPRGTTPATMAAPPGPGTVSRKVTMIGDSFASFADPFLAATFTDLTVMHVDFVRTQTWAAAASVVDSEVVVVEVVERSLAGGVSPVLDQRVLDTLAVALARHPVRR